MQAPPRAPTSPYALLALLMAMTALGPLTLNILVPAVPNLAAVFNTDTATVQLTISLYLFGLAISQLVLGPLSDRFGRRPVVIMGLTITALASVLAIAMASIGGLIAARGLQALGASTGLVIGRAIIRDLYDRERAASMIGWVTTVMVVAPMLAPLIGGLLDTALGWQSIFVFVAVAGFAVLIWAFLGLPETRPDHVTGGGMRFVARETRELLGDRNFIGYMLAGSIATATFFSFLGGAPHLVIGIMGRSSAEYGAWFALTAFGYMIGNLIAARLSPRFGVDTMIRAGIGLQILGAVGSIVLAHAFPLGGPETVFPAQFFLSCGNGIFLPNAVAGAISVRPQAAGTASGITGFVQMGLGAVAAQAMSTVIAHSSTAQPMAWTMFILAVLAMVLFMILVRPARSG
ncbi:MAG TPA: multidrug effflux MFS transporter [Pseudorhodoplanes sp.]|nr:multidrug effflux MFS transporter [Pseudorhodoplanes sp.]